MSNWIWETWKFVKQIFPLLIVGVFLAGIVRVIIPESWVRTIAGRNTIVISEFTCKLAGDGVEVLARGAIRVKSRRQPVNIFTLRRVL